jgi:N-dimethylarginine dimethylaminohydrolase
VIAAGFPKFKKVLTDIGYEPIELDMSEFQKMDGELTA